MLVKRNLRFVTPPCSYVWHWEHLILKIFSPRFALPSGMSAMDVSIESRHKVYVVSRSTIKIRPMTDRRDSGFDPRRCRLMFQCYQVESRRVETYARLGAPMATLRTPYARHNDPSSRTPNPPRVRRDQLMLHFCLPCKR